MFYKPQNGHTLPHNPFNAIVTPRPIGWISSRDADGNDNLAPYSFSFAPSPMHSLQEQTPHVPTTTHQTHSPSSHWFSAPTSTNSNND